MPSRAVRESIREYSKAYGRYLRAQSGPLPLRRSPRLAAKLAQQEAAVAAAPAPAPVAPAEAKPVCTMAAHEASCAWCREHPEWRQIKDNIGLMLIPFMEDTIKSKAARAAAALGLITYVNDVAVGFVRAHKKLMDVLIDRCRHCIENAGAEYSILSMVCSDLIRKLTA